MERFFNRGVDVAPTRDHLSALSTQLGVAGDSMQSIQLRFDSPKIGIDKTLTPSMAIISDGNSGRNYALSYAPNHTSRIIELPAGVLSSFETKLQTTNRQSVTDTNTRYTASSPTVHAPIDFVKPIPAVGNSIQSAGTASGPAVSVLVTEGVTEGSGETFIGKAEKEGGD